MYCSLSPTNRVKASMKITSHQSKLVLNVITVNVLFWVPKVKVVSDIITIVLLGMFLLNCCRLRQRQIKKFGIVGGRVEGASPQKFMKNFRQKKCIFVQNFHLSENASGQ